MTADEPGRPALVVVGASAGGVDALTAMARDLPQDLGAAVLVVLHVAGTSLLPKILDRAGPLPAAHAADGEPIVGGRIYVAPPGRHMVVEHGLLRLVEGPRENGHRPAIDPLMRSAASDGSGQIVGILLSGTRDDGSAGLARIKAAGGMAIVQDPEEAMYPGMPQNALDSVEIDHVLSASAIGGFLASLEGIPARDVSAVNPAGDDPREHSGITCPECGGVLDEIREGDLLTMRCRVGHAYSHESLLAEQARRVESQLWAAARSLEERAELLRRMAERARVRGYNPVVERSEKQAEAVEGYARTIKELLARAHLETPEVHKGDEEHA